MRCPVQGVEAPGWQGAKRANIAGYSTDEQRSQPGCIGGLNDQVIRDRGLGSLIKLICAVGPPLAAL
jgi:hypothetical protein